MLLCHLLGTLLHVLYFNSEPKSEQDILNSEEGNEPSSKKKSVYSTKGVIGDAHSKNVSYSPIDEFEFSSSVWSLVKNLLDCGWGDFRPDKSYPSLESASKDMHLMLLNPERFLFNYYEKKNQANPPINGRVQLQICREKLYGREVESSIISETFCRVSTSGKSEAMFVGGWSGSGKSRLISGVFESVSVAGGLVVTRKFDDVPSQSPLAVVLSAINGLCMVLKQTISYGDMLIIEEELVRVFGRNLAILHRMIPNVVKLIARPDTIEMYIRDQSASMAEKVNLMSIHFLLKNFMSVISNKERPIMIVCDDLQWVDSAAVGAINAILSLSSYLFFVGSYRDNEVQQERLIFKLMNDLELLGVRTTKLTLHALKVEDTNTMISDALCILPRLCRTLSAIIHSKTQGNPLFVLSFLESLVERNLLQYSYRDRCWVWEENKIRSEEIADGVLELLTAKMNKLAEGLQEALKIASCFGAKVKSDEVDLLSRSGRFACIKTCLEQAAVEGFMEFNKSSWSFVHDKVREAAYGLIKKETREDYHYAIGMELYTISRECNDSKVLFSVVNQINHGITLVLRDPSLQFSIAELNLRAGRQAVSACNFMASYSYLKVGVSLLPDESWVSRYDLSLNLFISLAEAAFASGCMDDAYQAASVVLKKGESLEDKLHCHTMVISILNTRNDVLNAYSRCCEVLSELGETIPAEVDQDEVISAILSTGTQFSTLSEDDLCTFKETTNKTHITIMQIYDQMILTSYHAKPQLMHYYGCKWAALNLKFGICKYSPSSLAQFATALCSNIVSDIESAYRIGKLALALMKRFDVPEMVPRIYLCFYGYVAFLKEPFQTCSDMLRTGYDVGMGTGQIVLAVINRVHMVPRAMFGGMKLSDLNIEVGGLLKLLRHLSLTTLEIYVALYQETVSLLSGNEDTLSVSNDADSSVVTDYSQSVYLQRLMSSYWRGRFEQAKYYAEKFLSDGNHLKETQNIRSIMISFYYGLTMAALWRKKKLVNAKSVMKRCIKALKEAAEYSRWNFGPKLLLLEAEMSSMKNNISANFKYDKAITAARDSKFVHKQGLACEVAALHHKLKGCDDNAKRLYQEAKHCFAKYGSQMKVDLVEKHINSFR